MTKQAEIHIFGPLSKIEGEYPKQAVKHVTSYPVEGAHYSKAFKKGLWDGRKHLSKQGIFPTGLLDGVKKVFDIAQTPVTIVDHREHPNPQGRSFDLLGVKMEGKYSYQMDAVKTAIEKRQGILRVATGGGKSELACAITKYLQMPTLFIVTTRELLYQGRDRFMKRLGLTEADVGLIGDGHWQPGKWITVATLDTLESRLAKEECKDFLKTIKVLFVDEVHHLGSDTFYTVCLLCPADWRFGLSGTPMDRTDGANLRLLAAIGPIIVDIPNKTLVDLGVTAKANIIFTRITQPPLKKNVVYKTAYKEGVVENPNVLQSVVDWTKIFHTQNLSTLILVEEIAHGKLIDDALWTQTNNVFIPHLFIHGTEDTDTRAQALKDFGTRKLPVLIASVILDEGVDVPAIDALILAGSRKSRIKTMQRLGRGLRGDKLIAVEFANFTHDYLLKHSLQRYEDYKKEDCFPLFQSGPDAALVKKLWEEK